MCHGLAGAGQRDHVYLAVQLVAQPLDLLNGQQIEVERAGHAKRARSVAVLGQSQVDLPWHRDVARQQTVRSVAAPRDVDTLISLRSTSTVIERECISPCPVDD